MLGKLLKYELKATAHYFLPLFAATLIFPVIMRLFGGIFGREFSWIGGLLMFIEVVLMIALAVMVLVITIQRFYKNLLGSEGYLMFTLPVSAHHNILSKLLAATLWNIASGLVVTISIFIIAGSANIAEMLSSGWQVISNFLRFELNLSPAMMFLQWAIVGLICVACNILVLYLAMSIGQLANERKFLASFGAYVGIQIAGGIAASIIGASIAAIPDAWIRALNNWFEALSIGASVQIITLIVALAAIISGAVYYFLTYWLLKRKLNLT